MKKLIALILAFVVIIPGSVFAAETGVDVSLNTSESFGVTVNCEAGVAAYAFVYTYKCSDSGIKQLYNVKKIDVPLGGTVSFDVNPPESGFTEKLAIFNKMTLAPLCKAYEYPYIINISTEALGFKLKNYGTEEKDGKTYIMNEYDIINFEEYDPEEFSAVTLLAKAR